MQGPNQKRLFGNLMLLFQINLWHVGVETLIQETIAITGLNKHRLITDKDNE